MRWRGASRSQHTRERREAARTAPSLAWGLLALFLLGFGCAPAAKKGETAASPAAEAGGAQPKTGAGVRGGDVGVVKAIRGKVIGVDQQLGLVVINVGERHGVKRGQSLNVFLGDLHVGTIIVDEVYPEMSAGRCGKFSQVRVKVHQPDEPIRGKVIGVDQQLGLVIIDVGQRRGVKIGHSFMVVRGNKYVGKVVVDEVFPGVVY